MLRVVLFIFFLLPYSALLADAYPIHAFKSYHQPEFENMWLIGQVKAKSKLLSNAPRFLDYDNRETVISGILYDPSQVRVGDTISILEKSPNHEKYKNGYIVGEGTVLSIFKTEFQGWMFKATGNFSMVHEGHYIAVARHMQNRAEALALFQRGNREQEKENLHAALALYKESLQHDFDKPETYLAISRVAQKLGMQKESDVYLEEAWKKISKFSDLSAALELPAYFLPMRLRVASEQSSLQQRLVEYISILQELEIYNKKISYYQVQNPFRDYKNNSYSQLFYYQGLLYENIFFILRRQPVSVVFQWLENEQRNMLLKEIFLPPFTEEENNFVQPTKTWDKAFFMAAIANYRLAHSLNTNEIPAAYRLVLLAHYKLQNFPLPKEKDFFYEMLIFYGNEVLRLPAQPAQMAQVRRMQETTQSGL